MVQNDCPPTRVSVKSGRRGVPRLGRRGKEVQAVTDRNFWETERGTKETVAVADEMLNLIKPFAPQMELKYNKFYTGLAKHGQSNNFAIFFPKKSSFHTNIYLKSSPEIHKQLAAGGIDVMDYDKRGGAYRLRLAKQDIKQHSALLLRLLKMSYGLEVDSEAPLTR
jgi:hypothetical protein